MRFQHWTMTEWIDGMTNIHEVVIAKLSFYPGTKTPPRFWIWLSFIIHQRLVIYFSKGWILLPIWLLPVAFRISRQFPGPDTTILKDQPCSERHDVPGATSDRNGVIYTLQHLLHLGERGISPVSSSKRTQTRIHRKKSQIWPSMHRSVFNCTFDAFLVLKKEYLP